MYILVCTIKDSNVVHLLGPMALSKNGPLDSRHWDQAKSKESYRYSFACFMEGHGNKESAIDGRNIRHDA
jgi:hypothetical protein